MLPVAGSLHAYRFMPKQLAKLPPAQLGRFCLRDGLRQHAASARATALDPHPHQPQEHHQARAPQDRPYVQYSSAIFRVDLSAAANNAATQSLALPARSRCTRIQLLRSAQHVQAQLTSTTCLTSALQIHANTAATASTPQTDTQGSVNAVNSVLPERRSLLPRIDTVLQPGSASCASARSIHINMRRKEYNLYQRTRELPQCNQPQAPPSPHQSDAPYKPAMIACVPSFSPSLPRFTAVKRSSSFWASFASARTDTRPKLIDQAQRANQPRALPAKSARHNLQAAQQAHLNDALTSLG
ncbi:hypothetical protein FQR65_LT20615 [Abscondita terminalis]|nr:hypothetical protein FQR65_LT20615 [Abscondita terminalis]